MFIFIIVILLFSNIIKKINIHMCFFNINKVFSSLSDLSQKNNNTIVLTRINF